MPEPAERNAPASPAREREKSFWKDYFPTVLASLATILSLIVGWRAKEQEGRVETLRVDLERVSGEAERTRLERTDREALNFKLFEAVRASLSSVNENEQRAVAALVTTLADSAFASNLLAAMQQQAVPEVRGELRRQFSEASGFDADQAQLAARAAPTGSGAAWRCDIFWVARGAGESRAVADRIEAEIRRRMTRLQPRVRELPDLVNARAGYRATGFEIRFDREEQSQAEELKRHLDPLVAGRGGAFVLRLVGTRTPGYLSVFVNP